MVAQICNRNIWEAEIGRILVPGQPREKVSETPPISTNKISKITKAQRAGGVVQVVELLTSN
jgi:hypothetical protein